MAFIETIPPGEATGAVADMYEADRATNGYVPNYTAAFAGRPAVYAAWRQLVGAVKANMDERRYELATVAAARRLRSSYCTLAHGRILAERFMPPADVSDVVSGQGSGGLDETDRAVMELADKVAADATSVTQADIDRLRGLGLTDADIFDVAAAAGIRCFFSKTLDALGVQPDVQLGGLDAGLRDVLTVGRPIATG